MKGKKLCLTIAKGVETLRMKMIVAVVEESGVLFLVAVTVGRAEADCHVSIVIKQCYSLSQRLEQL